MCSRPRNPQRKPKPSATELSGSKKNDASLSCSLSRASRSCVVLVASTVIEAGENHGFDVFKSRQRLGAGRSSSVMVSPMRASATFLMLAMMNPTSPAASSSNATGLGVSTPRVSTSKIRVRSTRAGSSALAQACLQTRAPAPPLRDRDRTRNRKSAPAAARPASLWAAGRAARSLRARHPRPCPVLALISSASLASRPTALSICSLVRSMSALGQIDLVDDRNDFEVVIDSQI